MTIADRIFEILREAKKLAQEYRALTGKPLGIAGEVAEYETARLLSVELQPARSTGFDAIDVAGRRLQVKGRCVLPTSSRGQKLGKIDKAVLFVEMDKRLDAVEIIEADRGPVIEALTAPPFSKARHIRGQLSVTKFRSIGRSIWKRTTA
jgi:hypothetical protein